MLSKLISYTELLFNYLTAFTLLYYKYTGKMDQLKNNAATHFAD